MKESKGYPQETWQRGDSPAGIPFYIKSTKMVASVRPDESVIPADGKDADAVPNVPSPSSTPPAADDLSTIMNPKPADLNAAEPSPSRTAVEAMYKRLPRFYKGHKEHRTQWDHPLLTKIFDEDIASFNDVRYAAYRTALKFRTLSNRLQLHQIKLSTIRSVLKQHGYEAVYQNQVLLPCVELETLMADIYLSARREVPSIAQPELNAELLLSLLLKLYDTNRYGCIKLISAKIGLALLSSGSYLEKWKYILSELFDYSRSISRKNAFQLLHDVARIPEILGEKRLFGTHLVSPAVESIWVRGRPGPSGGILEDGFRHWLKDEPQTLVWLSTSYRIRQAERLRHFVKCSICKAYPMNGLRYRCLRCYNYNMCQSCFFTGKFNKSHRLRHPIREYCSLVTAGQETKDLIKIMKNRVFKGEEYEQKPRYMPIMPDSASTLEVGADSEPETDNRSRSTAASHNSTGTFSGSLSAVNKKDFEVDVEVISELDSTHGANLERSTSNIPRSISEPLEANARFALQHQQFNDDSLIEEPEVPLQEPIRSLSQRQTREEPFHEPNRNLSQRQPREQEEPLQEPIRSLSHRQIREQEVPLPEPSRRPAREQEVPLQEASRNQTQRQISAVTAQILNYAEVDVVFPRAKMSTPSVGDRVNYSQVQISRPPFAEVNRGHKVDDVGSQTDPEFSALDYIDASPRGELPIQYDRAQQSRGLYPNVVSKSSVEIQTDVTEQNGLAGRKSDGIGRKVNGMLRANRDIPDQFDQIHRLAESSSPSPEFLLSNERRPTEPSSAMQQNRNAVFETQLEQLEKMLVDNLGPRSATNGWAGHPDKSSPVWKLNDQRTYVSGAGRPPLPRYSVPRSESFNESLHQRNNNESRLPPFPVDRVPKATSDPNTPQRRVGPPTPQRHVPVPDSNGISYHPILDELEEKLKSLNAPLTQRDKQHPFWHHLKEKFEYVLGNANKPATASHTYQSYGKIDKDYAHTPAAYGRHIAHNSTLDVSDSLLPGITQPSPNESQSSGFSSGRETDMKWEEESYHGPPVARNSSSATTTTTTTTVTGNSRVVPPPLPRSKSLGVASSRQQTEDIAQLDKLLAWLDEFKRST